MSKDAKSRKRRNGFRSNKTVALAIVSHGNDHGRRKIMGIIDYYKKHAAWKIYCNSFSQPFVMPEDLMGWRGDGVIGEIYTKEDVSIFNALSMPVVNTASSTLAQDVPSVRVDNDAIGRMAAEHLMSCKLDNFAFIGPRGLCHADERCAAFVQTLEQSVGSCTQVRYEPYDVSDVRVSEELVMPDELLHALSHLELPVGIMVSSDRVGFAVLEACRKLGFRSPEDVALVGVDDDEVCCNLAYVSMTSIAPNAREIGFRASDMLDKLMSNEPLENAMVLVPPLRIVQRDSTDMTRSEYPEVALALRFIRNHAGDFIDVSNVLAVVPVSRRWLEIKFNAEVGHGIYQEIRRVHIERAKELLMATDWSVARISRESGFNNTERFDFAFQKLMGMSATEYRNQE